MRIEECIEKLTAEAELIYETEEVDIDDAVGRILARDVEALINVPPFNRSAMDGYAVRSCDVPATLKVAGKLLAGDYSGETAQLQTAVRVMTGAYIPDGYDAVVKQEDTDMGENQVEVYKGVKPYENYCKIGEDIRDGEIVASKGTQITYLHVGLFASLGMKTVTVQRKLRVTIVSTGSELSEIGKPLPPGKIYGSVGHILKGAMERAGVEVLPVRLCGDDEKQCEALIREALKTSDFIITTGAVSVGERDFIPLLLDDLGAKILFRGADIQPGTPTMASVLDKKIILSLSGNPYAALANFEVYFWEAMAAMTGCDDLKPKSTTAVLASEYHKINRHRRLIRAKAEGGKVYLPTEVHSSSVINNMIECNCFIDLEAGRQVKIGDEVRVRYIKWI